MYPPYEHYGAANQLDREPDSKTGEDDSDRVQQHIHRPPRKAWTDGARTARGIYRVAAVCSMLEMRDSISPVVAQRTYSPAKATGRAIASTVVTTLVFAESAG